MTDAVLSSRNGPLLHITLNRPDVRNAIDSSVSTGVLAALEELDSDDELRVGVLSGTGRTFCAGLDLRAFAEHGLPKRIGRLFRHEGRKPLVAAVEGAALGGGLELALVADLVVAADDALLGSPEVRFGLFPGGSALMKLPRTMPLAMVTRLALTGEPITARRAHELGLVVELTPPGGAVEAATGLATTIAANAPLGVQAALELLRRVPGRAPEELWQEQDQKVAEIFASDDAAEGARAFAERRPPRWTGR
ncbi:MAG TPA: enoyl-CoA hydratase-related protein [Acidimicrobiales bacterium]